MVAPLVSAKLGDKPSREGVHGGSTLSHIPTEDVEAGKLFTAEVIDKQARPPSAWPCRLCLL